MDLDQQSQSILSTVHPEIRERICLVYQDVFTRLGLEMRPTRGLSSFGDQQALWMMGRDIDGNIVDESKIVTNAPPGSSWHNFGLAVDSCFRGSDPYWRVLSEKNPNEARSRWNKFGEICVAHGFEWGGHFPRFDGPHAQMKFGMTLRDAQDLWKLGGLSEIFFSVDKIIKGDSNG